MTAWAHLPNAKHIDWVLADVKQNPKAWGAAWRVARGAAWRAAWDAAWRVARGAARDADWDAARGAARDAAWSACAAFVAYDDAGEFVDHSVDQLKVLHRLTDHPMYLLLQPYAAVKGQK